jgi:hypothetical protein
VPDEGRALARLTEASAAMLEIAGWILPGWAVAQVARLIEAWGQLEPETAVRTLEAAAGAAIEAGGRVSAELAEMLALDPELQRSTPLQIVRGAVREPTAVLAAAGIPEVVRDEFSERSWPDDVYDLTPRTFRDVDEDLAAVHFAWGMAKAEVLRARRARPGSGGKETDPG